MFVAEPGARIGAWVLEARVGIGGLAEVWRAVPSGGGEPVAVKLLLD